MRPDDPAADPDADPSPNAAADGAARPFHQRLHDRMAETDSRVCLGVDPRPERHRDTHPSRHEGDPAKVARAVAVYFRDLIDAARPHLACVKVQSAFFERMGVPGMIAMAQVLADVRARELPCILDVKRGDVGATAQAYADAYLADGVFAADAVTVNPYLGMDALEPFVTAAAERGRGLFALVRTSNPGGGDLQDLALAATPTGARTVAERVADLLTERARDLGVDDRGYGPLGAVVGGTEPARSRELRARLPHAILLVPGYGAQGATAADVAPAFDADGFGAVVSASRSLTYLAGDDPPAEAARAAAAMREELAAALR